MRLSTTQTMKGLASKSIALMSAMRMGLNLVESEVTR